MEAFFEFIRNWGYLAVFLGAMVEGESVILTASSLAFFGYLDIKKVMVVAFLGTLIADQVLYMIGRRYGMGFFRRYPSFVKPADKAFHLLKLFDIWFILSFRFIYGIRIVSSAVVGAAQVPSSRFIPLNIIAALLWTVISCMGGYYLGDVMEDILRNMDLVQKYLLFIIVGIVGLIGAIIFFKKRMKNNT